MEVRFYLETQISILLFCFSIPELKESQASVVAIKKQAESTNAEYDRLAEENQKLQVRLTRLTVTSYFGLVLPLPC